VPQRESELSKSRRPTTQSMAHEQSHPSLDGARAAIGVQRAGYVVLGPYSPFTRSCAWLSLLKRARESALACPA